MEEARKTEPFSSSEGAYSWYLATFFGRKPEICTSAILQCVHILFGLSTHQWCRCLRRRSRPYVESRRVCASDKLVSRSPACCACRACKRTSPPCQMTQNSCAIRKRPWQGAVHCAKNALVGLS